MQLDQTSLTKRWMRDASDELAVRNGCWFSWKRGSYAVWWKERYLILYEGSAAGQPMRLRGLHSVALDWPIPRRWDDDTAAIYGQRMLDYLDGREAGEPCDWQYEWSMRLYGWVRWSDHWNENIRRYRSGALWCPKKNKKSPGAASDALYLGCGDGEPGNHIGLCAKDGAQARDIVGKHSIEMVNNSDELRAECKINLNEYMVTHLPSKSTIKPLSSSNERNTKAKEGFNGSLVVDECHVVDWAFMRRMTRAGISRKQPLHLEFSTAGNEPDGYGKDRRDWGKEVAEGKREVDTHLHLAYEADQTLDIRAASDAELESAARLANPALGHTVQFSELMADIKQSCRRPADAADCMMYRLNIWQTSSSPWIPAHVWDACGDKLDLGDYRGARAIVGFDKSSSRDFAAFVAGVPEVGENGLEKLTLFPWIVAPRAYIETHRHEMPKWTEWEQNGWLKLSPGDKIDIGYLMSVFERINEAFDVSVLGYDPHRAEELTQIVSEGVTSHTGETLFDGFGVERVPIGMRGYVLSSAVEEFENHCQERKIVHGRHPVLDWMIGNVNVVYRQGMTRIEKPNKDSVRKIDGAMASVICFAVAYNPDYQPETSVYESRGVLYL